jgi:hypothetical protein
MKTALDMFGPHEVSTLGNIVLNIEEFDEEAWLYVMPARPFEPETPALVVDEGSDQDWRIVRELGLVEHAEIYMVKEIVDSVRNRRDEPNVEAIVHALESF